jgi:hypothetical protein
MKHLFALILVTACTTDPLEPGAGDQPGSGTSTLSVQGRASALPRVPNARTPNDYDTYFSVQVERGDTPVTTGYVTVKSTFVNINLQYRDDNGYVRWEGSAAGYDEVYQLDVTSEADEVRGVIVDGPDIHVFTSPMAGATLDSTVPNTIRWQRGGEADLIQFQAERLDRITITDSGTYEMPAGALHTDSGEARRNTIEIRRSNHVAPAGATGGSDFEIMVHQMLEVVALPAG